jgi:4-aminobutyrate aminotransferase/(S)-3-amino-2-methylpropionate transaminase
VGDLKNIDRPKVMKIPGPRASNLYQFYKQYVPKAIYNIVPTFIKRGEGAVFQDVDGNVFIDFAGGIGVLNIGYSHPEVVEVVKEQAEKFFHSSINEVLYESYVELAKKLTIITPGDYPKKTMFVNSGAEAVENAIKIVRSYTKKTDIICFEGAYHGRTSLAMALTSKVKPYCFGFGPFPSGIHKIPFGYCYRCAYGLERNNCGLRCAERLDEIFTSVVSPENVAAVIIEPIQGESGFILPPDEYFTRIKEICEKNNILLIDDEIQTGFCRTGKMFAAEYWSVIPDILITSKSIAGGIPLSAVCGKAEIMDSVHIGGIGGTFSGNPLACSAGLKIIEIMGRDNFEGKALHIGKIIKDRFESMKEKYPLIGDVRGRGAMVAMELVKDRSSKDPAKEETKSIIEECYQNGLVILSAGLYSNVIRVLVPLVVTDAQLNSGLGILEKAIGKIGIIN